MSKVLGHIEKIYGRCKSYDLLSKDGKFYRDIYNTIETPRSDLKNELEEMKSDCSASSNIPNIITYAMGACGWVLGSAVNEYIFYKAGVIPEFGLAHLPIFLIPFLGLTLPIQAIPALTMAYIGAKIGDRVYGRRNRKT